MIELRAAGVALALAVATATGCATEADDQSLRATFAEQTETTSDVPRQPTTTRDLATTTTAAPTTTESTTTTAPPLPGFETGTWVVGTDVQPGRYVSGGQICYWERLSGLTGSFDEIIVNGNAEGPAIVDILPGDVAFTSNGCGRWTLYQPPPAPVAEFGPGDWVVGEQIVPGTYQSDGPFCMWERASGFSHDYDEILGYDFPDGRAVVEILAGDVRFTSMGCGPWTPA